MGAGGSDAPRNAVSKPQLAPSSPDQMLIVEIGMIELRKVMPNSVHKTNQRAEGEILPVGNEAGL